MNDQFAHLVHPSSPLMAPDAPAPPPTLADAHPAARQYAQVALQMAMSLLKMITDEVSFQAGKKAIAALIGDEVAQHLGPHFDPRVLQQAAALGQKAMAEIQAQGQPPLGPQGAAPPVAPPQGFAPQ